MSRDAIMQYFTNVGIKNQAPRIVSVQGYSIHDIVGALVESYAEKGFTLGRGGQQIDDRTASLVMRKGDENTRDSVSASLTRVNEKEVRVTLAA